MTNICIQTFQMQTQQNGGLTDSEKKVQI